MLKKFIAVSGILLIVGFSSFFFYKYRVRENMVLDSGSPRLKIVASFYVLGDFTKRVGGDNIDVRTIIPAGAEPHEYEPTPKDIADIYSARLFLYQGGGFDQWADQFRGEIQQRGIAAVPMAEHFTLLNNDPHIWLDPVLAQKEIEIIRDYLIRADPQNAGLYANNATLYTALLADLDKKYRDGLLSCGIKEIVVSHSAYQYLAQRYGLSLISIAGLSPEQEPSLRKIAEIIRLIRAKGIKYIFIEPLAGSKAAQAVALETGANSLILNPIEGLPDADIAAGKNYLSLMEENLKNLRTALLCD